MSDDIVNKLRTAAARGAPGTRNPSDYTASRLSAQDALDAADEIDRVTSLNTELLEALTSAMHALRSYQYHNGSTELAESVADKCETIIAKAEGSAE